MGESPSARTERELVALRGELQADIDTLVAKARRDANPRNLVGRNPAAAIGAAGSAALVIVGSMARRGRDKKVKDVRRSMSDRVKEATFIAATTALTTVAANAAKRFAARFLNDES